MSATKLDELTATGLPFASDEDHWVCCKNPDITLCLHDGSKLTRDPTMEESTCSCCELIADSGDPDDCPVFGGKCPP